MGVGRVKARSEKKHVGVGRVWAGTCGCGSVWVQLSSPRRPLKGIENDNSILLYMKDTMDINYL